MEPRHQVNNKFTNYKGHLKIEMELVSIESQLVLLIVVTNTNNQDEFTLKFDKYEINRNRHISKIFQNSQEIFKEIVGEFDDLQVTEEEEAVVIHLEVALGKYRTEHLELVAYRKNEGSQSNAMSQYSQEDSGKKVFLSPAYMKDFSFFKKEIEKVCVKVGDLHQTKKMTVDYKLKKSTIKNMFITISNSILKNYKENTEVTPPEYRHKENFVQYEAENKLLEEKNKLLHKTYEKAVEKVNKLNPPKLDIQFDIEEPKDLRVLTSDGNLVPLSEYLPQADEGQTRKAIEFHERKIREMREARARCAAYNEMCIKEAQRVMMQRANKVNIRRIERMGPMVEDEDFL